MQNKTKNPNEHFWKNVEREKLALEKEKQSKVAEQTAVQSELQNIKMKNIELNKQLESVLLSTTAKEKKLVA